MDVEAQAERAVFLQVVGLMLTSVASCFLVARIPEGVIEVDGQRVALLSESPVRHVFLIMALLGAVVTFVGFALTPRWPFRAHFGAWWHNDKLPPGRFERLQYAGRMPEMSWLPGALWVPFARAGILAGLLLLLLGMKGAALGGDAAFVPFLVYLGFWWMYQCCQDVRYPHWFFGLVGPFGVRVWARLRARRDPALVRIRGRVQATGTVRCPLEGDDAVLVRSYLGRGDGVEREYVIHDRAADFDIVTDAGERVRVRVEDVEVLGRTEAPRVVAPMELPAVWRRRMEGDMRGHATTLGDDLWPRQLVRVSRLCIREGDIVEVIGARGEDLDTSAATTARAPGLVATVAAPAGLPLLVFPAAQS